MYLLRDAHTVDMGGIPGAVLFGARRYDGGAGPLTDPASVRAATLAHWHRASELLARARRLRPTDARLVGWAAAAAAHERSQPGAVLDDADKGRLLAAVDTDPHFNLFTPLVLLRHEPRQSPHRRALVARTTAMLAAQPCKDPQPGTRAARICRDTPLAPWNEEAATVILADVYLRTAEDALREGDVPAAMPALGTAKAILGTLEDATHRSRVAQWKHAPRVEARVRRLASIAPGSPVPDASFWRSDAAEAVYACSACHTP